jgi:competence protein ComGF
MEKIVVAIWLCTYIHTAIRLSLCLSTKSVRFTINESLLFATAILVEVKRIKESQTGRDPEQRIQDDGWLRARSQVFDSRRGQDSS